MKFFNVDSYNGASLIHGCLGRRARLTTLDGLDSVNRFDNGKTALTLSLGANCSRL